MVRLAQWSVVLALVCCGAACVRRTNDTEGDANVSLSDTIKPELVEPFVPEELPSIQGNHMHELHFAGGAHCGECHPSTRPMPIQQAHEICADCHPSQQVAKPIWKNHCLACHHFTQASQIYERNPEKMVENLCRKCHTGDGLGGTIYTLSGHADSEMALCDHCHRPHESDAPAAAELCATCHEELAEVRHPAGGKAKCSICHGAHRPPPDGAKLCTSCHGKAENVLVHKIPNHPENCLACHNAHFTTIEIKGVCVDCHENLVYRGGQNQPAAHQDCENCHSLENFSYKGHYVCANCHEQEGAVRQDDRVPSKHKRCTTCHHPHSWRAPFSQNCMLCHELSAIVEHELEFHPSDDCRQCHDPHHTADMPKTGSCAACHEDVPSFGTGVPELHLVCENCHAGAAERDFSFAGPESSCQICHAQALTEPPAEWSEAPAGHVMCTACHATHSWKLAAEEDSCAICHGDVVEQAPNEFHQTCFNCHQPNHLAEFVGVDGSCLACHAEPPGTHSAAGHAECFNCHAQHSFAADATLCTICHADLAEDHYPEETCTECHSFRE